MAIGLRVGILCRYLTPEFGGGARLATEMADALQKRGHKVILFAKKWDIRAYSKLDGKKLVCLPLNTLETTRLTSVSDMIRISMFLIKKLKKYNLNVLIFDDMNYLAYPIKKLFKIPVLLYIHFPYWKSTRIVLSKVSRFSQVIRTMEKRLYRDLDLVLCNSYFTKDFIKASLNIDAEVLYPPVNTNYFKPGSACPKDNLVISVGMFHPDKELDILIKLFKEHVKGDYKLVIAGARARAQHTPSYYRQLCRLADDDERVTILPNLSDLELRSLYQMASVYCHARRWEHYGITLVEAMASGVPVVAMRGGGPTETIVEFKTGILADTTKDLIRWTKYLLENRDERLRMGKEARKHVREKFNVDTFGRTLEKCLIEICKMTE